MNTAKETKKSILLYTVLFILVSVIGFGIVPLSGKLFIIKADCLGQYYVSYLYIGQYIRELLTFKAGISLYDLSIGMGEDIAGCLNYYGFGDPFVLLSSVFADKNTAPYIFSSLYFIRLYLAGIAFLAYCFKMKLDKTVSAVAVFGYLFAATGIMNIKIPVFVTALIILPLFLTGVEGFLKDEAPKASAILLTVTALYAGMNGFYLTYMVGIFVIIYSVTRACFLYGFKDVKKWLTPLLKALGCVVTGLFLSSPFLVPAVCAFLYSESSETGILTILSDYHNYLPSTKFLKAAFSYPISGTVHFQGLCLAEVITGILVFFSKKSRARLQCMLAVIVCALGFSLPITGYIFNAFSESYTRWAFCIWFVMAVIFIHVLTRAEFRFTLQKFRLILLILLVLNAAVNIITYYHPLGTDMTGRMTDKDTVLLAMESPVSESEVIARDHSLYRTGMDHYSILSNPENMAMLHDYNGLTYWFSMVNSRSKNTSDAINQTSEKWRSFGLGTDEDILSLFGVKYYLRQSSELPEDFEKREDITFHGENWEVYENPGYFGIAYVRHHVPKDMIPEDKDLRLDYFKRLYAEIKDNVKPVEVTEMRDGFKMRALGSEDSELVLTVPDYPGWKAKVDGKNVPVYETDGVNMAIALTEGAHEIEFMYRPLWPLIAGVLFTFGLVSCGLYVFKRMPEKDSSNRSE